MTTQVTTEIELDVLIAEAQRYLAAVEVFRAEGREPHWSREVAAPPPAPRRRRRSEHAAVQTQGGKHAA
jgi:hypothetical protein